MRALMLLPLLCLLGHGQEIPDPLLKPDGTRATTAEEWEKEIRPRTLQLFRENVYGITPVGKPEGYKSTLLEEIPDGLEGKATIKRIEISFNTPKGGRKIRPVIALPNDRKGPVPAFLLIINRRPNLLDPANPNPFFPMREIVARGYAAVAFHYGDVDIDKKDGGYEQGVRAQYDAVPPAPDAWGAIAAWAWGASRVMDHLETEPRIDPTRVAVIGHSRGGKTALWAAAEDTRFALAISNDSGCTGAAMSRTKKGEHIADINRLFPHWFCGNYKKFNGKENELPVDQHQLIALIAPRLVCVGSAIGDEWADPEAEFLSCVKASPVHALYKSAALGAETIPPLGKPLHQSNIGYHVRAGNHDLTLEDWGHYMDFADRHWPR